MEAGETMGLSLDDVLARETVEEGRIRDLYDGRRAAVKELAATIHQASAQAQARQHLEAALGNEVENARLDDELDRHLAELAVARSEGRPSKGAGSGEISSESESREL